MFVVLFYHWRKLGLTIFGIIQVLCWITTIIILTVYNFNSSYKAVSGNYWIVYYQKPYCRIGAYFIGLLSAIFLYSFKNETREESFFKRTADKLDKSSIIRWSFYLVGMFIMVFLIFSFYSINNYPDDYGLAFNVFYLTFSWQIFILGMNMFLMPILMGHGEIYRKFLAMDVFTPLAWITFGAYMTHPIFIMFNSLNVQRGTWGTVQENIVLFLAFLLSCYAASFVITIIVETPAMNLESWYLMGRRPENAKRKPREHQIKFSSGMAIDDASTTWSDSSFHSDSPDVSPKKRNGWDSLLSGQKSSDEEETRFSIKRNGIN